MKDPGLVVAQMAYLAPKHDLSSRFKGSDCEEPLAFETEIFRDLPLQPM